MALQRSRIVTLLVVVAVVAGLGYRIWLGPQIEVATTPVARGDLKVTVTPTETGTVDTDDTALVRAEVAASIIRVEVEEGQQVAQGVVLLRLDDGAAKQRVKQVQAGLQAAQSRLRSGMVQLRVEQARSVNDLRQAQAQYNEVESRYAKQKQLFDRGQNSESNLNAVAAELEVAKARLAGAQSGKDQVLLAEENLKAVKADVEQARAALRLAEDDLDHTVIRAPIAGTITSLPVKKGELVTLGQTVAQITLLDHLYIRATIDEIDLSRLKLGQAVEIRFDTLPEQSFAARLSYIAPAVSGEKLQSRSVEVKLTLDHPPATLRPGMSADVEILVDEVKGILKVPTNVVMTQDGEHFVYTVEGGRIAKRIVEPGAANWDLTEIRKGLSAGEEVVTSFDVEGLAPGIRAVVKGAP